MNHPTCFDCKLLYNCKTTEQMSKLKSCFGQIVREQKDIGALENIILVAIVTHCKFFMQRDNKEGD
jgi:hypothetical protein